MTHNVVSMAALERAVSVINRILSKAQGSSAKDVAARNRKNVDHHFVINPLMQFIKTLSR